MALVNSAFTVNVTPGAMPPTVHVSEYDIGRTYTVTINGENGGAFNIPTGTTATVEGTLNGVIGFTTGATISGSNVSFTLTESMTARSGKAWCKIKLTLNDEPIQTCAFVLAVDRAGVEADTVIGASGFEGQIQTAVDNYLDEHGTGGDADALKQTLYLMLIPILREGLYGADQYSAIAALESALSGGSVTTYTITNALTNVTSSNSAAAVVSGAAYSATLTPASGMEMTEVSVTMGGADITQTAYSNGEITIASVTGNVVITAVAESLIETYTPTMTAGLVSPSTGTPSSSTSYQYTTAIPCREGDKIYGSCYDSGSSANRNDLAARFTAAYDENGNVNANGGTSADSHFTEAAPFVVPSGVYSLVFTMLNRFANDVVVYVDKSERVGA